MVDGRVLLLILAAAAIVWLYRGRPSDARGHEAYYDVRSDTVYCAVCGRADPSERYPETLLEECDGPPF